VAYAKAESVSVGGGGCSGGDVGYQGVHSSSGGLGGSFLRAKAPLGHAASTPVRSSGGGCFLGGKRVAYAKAAVGCGGVGDVGNQGVHSSVSLNGSFSGGSRQVEARPKMVGISLGGMKKAVISPGGSVEASWLVGRGGSLRYGWWAGFKQYQPRHDGQMGSGEYGTCRLGGYRHGSIVIHPRIASAFQYDESRDDWHPVHM